MAGTCSNGIHIKPGVSIREACTEMRNKLVQYLYLMSCPVDFMSDPANRRPCPYLAVGINPHDIGGKPHDL